MTAHRAARVGVVAAALLLPATAALTATPTTAAPAAPSARTFANCTELQKVYPHGVGRKKARDKTTGTPVTNFKRSKKLYRANKSKDRDKDGIACEKR